MFIKHLLLHNVWAILKAFLNSSHLTNFKSQPFKILTTKCNIFLKKKN